jgi:hypothetical protein
MALSRSKSGGNGGEVRRKAVGGRVRALSLPGRPVKFVLSHRSNPYKELELDSPRAPDTCEP